MNDRCRLFSERHGYTPPKLVQREAMDGDLRTGLWNAFYESFPSTTNGYILGGSASSNSVYRDIHCHFLKKSLTKYFDSHVDTNDKTIEQIFLSEEWHRVLDLVEYVARTHGEESFIDESNTVLTQENSAYRIIAGGFVTEITSEQEIKEIEIALKVPYAPAKRHLEKALALFSDRENSDYENSIKESISAVESIAKEITGEHSKPLGQLTSKLELHSAFEKGLKHLYGFASDAPGVRHAGDSHKSENYPPADQSTARFMLVICSAFVNYIIVRNPKI